MIHLCLFRALQKHQVQFLIGFHCLLENAVLDGQRVHANGLFLSLLVSLPGVSLLLLGRPQFRRQNILLDLTDRVLDSLDFISQQGHLEVVGRIDPLQTCVLGPQCRELGFQRVEIFVTGMRG